MGHDYEGQFKRDVIRNRKIDIVKETILRCNSSINDMCKEIVIALEEQCES